MRIHRTQRPDWFRLACLMGGLALTGCGMAGVGEPAILAAECGIAEDQAESFMPRMESSQAVQVVIDSRFYQDDGGYGVAVESALSSWNRVSELERGRPF